MIPLAQDLYFMGYDFTDLRKGGCNWNHSLYPGSILLIHREALDAKTPLLRSMDAVSEQGVRLLRLLGNTTSTKVTAGVGPEQENFIVDRDKYLQRDDLVFTGRTLFGAPAPRDRSSMISTSV